MTSTPDPLNERRCQEMNREGGQCELPLYHKGNHLAGKLTWGWNRPSRPAFDKWLDEKHPGWNAQNNPASRLAETLVARLFEGFEAGWELRGKP